MADYGHRISAGNLIFLREKSAALERGHSEQVEVVTRHWLAPNLFDLVSIIKFELPDGVAGQPAENLIAIAQLLVTRIRRAVVRLMWIAGINFDELVGICHRARTQKNRVDETEDRGVSADADRE